MRMWMVDPKIMCRQHLLGEHLEIHMFVGTINKGSKVSGFIKNNLLEISSLRVRHDALVEEMRRRKYNHQSPLEEYSCRTVPLQECLVMVDVEKSFNDLLGRCKECKENYEKPN